MFELSEKHTKLFAIFLRQFCVFLRKSELTSFYPVNIGSVLSYHYITVMPELGGFPQFLADQLILFQPWGDSAQPLLLAK